MRCGARVFRAHGKASSILALVNSPAPQASCIRRPSRRSRRAAAAAVTVLRFARGRPAFRGVWRAASCAAGPRLPGGACTGSYCKITFFWNY